MKKILEEPNAASGSWTGLDLTTFQVTFQPYLEAFLRANMSRIDSPASDQFTRGLLDYPATQLANGGKRQRPYVALQLYRASGGARLHETLKLLAALEVFHLFCLVHDDIIDRGTERHGLPSLHEHFQARLVSKKRLGDLAHLANGQAMLVGDLLFGWVQDAFWQTELPPDRVREARDVFGQMVDEVVVGQLIDVDVMSRPFVSTDLIERKMLLKTASYTFIRPMQIGLRLATADRSLDGFCESFGRHLGLAFQLQDDYLDLTAAPATSDKTLFADLRERQHTVFTQHIFEHGTAGQKRRLRTFFGKPVTLEDRDDILELFTQTGSLAQGKRQLDVHFDQAEALLATAAVDEATKAALGELVGYIRRRTA